MGPPLDVWEPVLRRLRLAPRGLRRGALRYASARVVVDWWAWEDPVRVRVEVRPREPGSGRLLIVPLDRSPTVPRYTTGDREFDARVAVLAGGRATLCRLGPELRRDVARLVARGAALTEGGCVFEPEVVASWTDPSLVLGQIRLAHDVVDALCGPLDAAHLLERWRVDTAEGVGTAVDWQVSALLPDLTGATAELACAAIEARGGPDRPDLLARMRITNPVLATWLRLCDPLDSRLLERVRDAHHSGDAEPLAQYLGFLLRHDDPAFIDTAMSLWAEANGDPRLVQALVARLEHVSVTVRSILLQVEPPNTRVAGTIAALLVGVEDARVDVYLSGWLDDWRAPFAIDALVQRVETALAHKDAAAAERVRSAAERHPQLAHALLRQLGPFADRWLATLKPRDDKVVVAVIGRLKRCGKPADRPLMFWLQHGSPRVQLKSAKALGEVGSSTVLPALEERGAGWLADASVKKACREAIALIRQRLGAGGLSLSRSAGGELSAPVEGGDLSEAG